MMSEQLLTLFVHPLNILHCILGSDNQFQLGGLFQLIGEFSTKLFSFYGDIVLKGLRNNCWKVSLIAVTPTPS